MADTVLLTNNTPLDVQAGTHQALSEHILQAVSSHQNYGDDFSYATETSDFPEMGYTYAAWWDSFSRHLVAHADAHQGMADCLRGVTRDFYTLDGSTSQS